ncbi:hypothetical protein GCM10028820_17810 [Tessaracoccus terricola]
MAGRKKNTGPRDMVISLLVLFVPIIAIYWFFTLDPEPEAEKVDYAPMLAVAQEESPYPVLRPVNLPEDWVPVRVAWAADGEPWINNEPAVGNSWQLGFMAPNQIYVAVQQRDRAPVQFIEQVTRDGVASGETVQLAEREWEQWVSEDGRSRSLVWRDGDLSAVVTGDTDFEQLEAFTAALAGTG